MTAPNPDSDGVVERLLSTSGPPSRYDFVLAIIPLALVVAAVAGAVGPLAFHDAILAGAAVGAVAVVDALFVNPPRDPS